jgi:catalase
MNIDRLVTFGKVKQVISILLLVVFLNACSDDPQVPLPLSENYAFEIIPNDEASKIVDIAKKTMQLQNKRAAVFAEAQDGQKLRGVHPKSHGCVIGDFVINKELDPEFQVGLFSKPGKKYKSLIRFSNASVRLSPDLENGENGSRGMAIKIFGVNGKVLVSDKGNNNQDFLMINTPGFAFPNVQSYQRLTNALLESASGADPSAAFTPASDWIDEDLVNLKKTVEAIGKIKLKTVNNPLEVQYFAAAPSSFGNDRVMKFSAEPCGGEKPQKPFSNTTKVSENYLNEALVSTMNQDKNICIDLKIQVVDIEQVKVDRAKNDGRGDIIEDATREWDEKEIPFISVAKITIPTSQTMDLSSPIQQECKLKSFNPWHSHTEHKPLGGINRLRKPVYINSTSNRLRNR